MNDRSIVRFSMKICMSLILALSFFAITSLAQTVSSSDRDRGHIMLEVLKDDIKKNYYDENFRGMDLDKRFKEADEKIKIANSNGQIFAVIAQAMIDLNDSHTFFLPPSRSSKVIYGWQMQMIGDKCFITEVKPGSDADSKGIKPGDEVSAINGFAPTRENLWKLLYMYNVLKPQPGLKLEVTSPEGKTRQLDAMAKIVEGRLVTDLTGDDDGIGILDMIREREKESKEKAHHFYKIGDVTVWKMPGFDLNEQGVKKAMKIINKNKALIVDLRGNPGGLVDMLQQLLGYFFEHDIKIGTYKHRKEDKPLEVKAAKKERFTGKMVVLVDSKSASCSEVFSRVMQLEKRATVLGDTTSGAVMVSRRQSHKIGIDTIVLYGASVTVADLIMTDGKSLEHVGVTPDEVILPTGKDMAEKKDPVLAKALQVLGFADTLDKAKDKQESIDDKENASNDD